MSQIMQRETVSGDAIIDGRYRYLLRRWWEPEGNNILLWILLNPSTADGQQNDATLRRIISFTRREGYSRLEVVNLFAYRSPSPLALKQVDDPVGPENEEHLQEAIARADKIIVGWGAFDALQGRDVTVLSYCKKPMYCLGITRQGYPRHPSRLSNETALVVYIYRGEIQASPTNALR